MSVQTHLQRLPGIRRLVESPRVHIRVSTVRGALAVTDPIRFALNEIFMRRRLRGYTLRRSGRRIFVRHPVADAWVVDEVLNRMVYQPPPHVDQILRRSGKPLRIADLGGHVGAASLLMLELFPDATVATFEPNPESARMLREVIRVNDLGDRCVLHEAAAGVREDTAMIEGFSLLSHFVREGESEAMDGLSFLDGLHPEQDQSHRIRILDVLPHLADSDLAKIDIEGGEWDILADHRFRESDLKAVVLEYHPQGAPGPDSLAEVRGLLSDAGFQTGEPFGDAGGVGTLWAWRD